MEPKKTVEKAIYKIRAKKRKEKLAKKAEHNQNGLPEEHITEKINVGEKKNLKKKSALMDYDALYIVCKKEL